MNLSSAAQWSAIVLGLSVMLSSEAIAENAPSKAETEALINELSEPLPGFQGKVHAFAFSPDGRHLAGMGGPFTPQKEKRDHGEYVFWQTENWEFVRKTRQLPNRGPDPSGQPQHVAFFRDGRRAVVVTDHHELQWFEQVARPRSGRTEWKLVKSLWLSQLYAGAGRSYRVNYPGYAPIQISPDEKLLAIPIRGAVTLNERSDDNKPLGILQIWKFAPTARTDKTPPALSHHLTLKHPDANRFQLCDLAFAFEGRQLITTTNSGNIQFWNPESGELIRQFAFDEGLPEALRNEAHFTDPRDYRRECYLSVSPDGKTLALGCERIIRLYDLENGQWQTHRHAADSPGGVGVLFHPSGQWLVSRHATQEMRIWSVPSLEPKGVFPTPVTAHYVPQAISFSPDGNWLVTGGYSPRRWSFNAMLRHAGTIR